MTEEKRRSFGGKTKGFTSKEEANFEKKHLRAYLKGRTHFAHGLTTSGNPKYHLVIEKWS